VVEMLMAQSQGALQETVITTGVNIFQLAIWPGKRLWMC